MKQRNGAEETRWLGLVAVLVATLALAPPTWSQSIRHVKLGPPQVNAGLLADPRNLNASIVLTKIPRGFFLEGDESNALFVEWEPKIAATLRYATQPGSRKLENYPNVLNARGAGQLLLNPAAEGMSTNIYYCILVSDEDPTVTSVEFKVIVQASAVPITRSPLGTVNADEGPPLFRWDAVEGVPYYLLFLSEGPLSIERDEEGKIVGLTGINLTWQAITPTNFMSYGDPDPSGNFTNAYVPPLLPGLEYNWIVLNAYGPGMDLVSGEVAPVAPSFFEVTRRQLPQTPTLLSPPPEEVIGDDEIVFEWSPVSGAARYRFFLYERSVFGGNNVDYTMWTQVTNDTRVRLKAGKLLVRTRYHWRVVAEGPGGLSASERRPFQYDGSAGWIKFTVNSAEGLLSRVSVEIRNELDGTILLPAVTDTFGIAKLALPTGTYSYRASRPGFLTTPRATFTVPPNDTGFVNIQLTRGTSTLAGQVVDAGGAPLFDARVEVSSGTVRERLRTEPSGYFFFSLKPGNWTLQVSKPEFVPSAPQTFTLPQDETVEAGQIVLQSATNIVSGQVTFAADGQPLGGATVRALQGERVYETATSAQGGYRFKLAPGSWRIVLDSRGFFASPPEYTFELGENETRTASFQLLAGGVVYGSITFQGLGVADVEVQAFSQESGELVQNTFSNTQGYYSLGLAPGDYELRVVSRNFLEARREVTIGENDTQVQDFVLSEAGFVQGTVINLETAAPVPGARVFVVQDSSIQTTTDAAGKYVLGLPPNQPFEIDAFFPGFGSNGPFEVTTVSGQTVFQDFLLKPLSGVIRGRVTDGFFPVPDASVLFEELDLTLTTDSDGEFEVEIPPGTYRVRVSKECHFTQTEVARLSAGQIVQLEIVLQALNSVITGNVTDVAGRPIVGARITATGDTVFTALSEEDGRYELCVNSGIFRVTATQAGYVPASTTLVISEGDSLGGIDFVLRDNFATLTGTVRDPEDTPIADAVVTLSNEAQTLRDTTAADGTFRIERIIPQVASKIQPSKPGFFGESTDFFFFGQQEIDLNLTLFPANGFIRGTVRDSESGAGVPGVRISAELSGNAEVFFRTETDDSGAYTLADLPVIPGRTYTVLAFKDGFFSPGPRLDVPPNSEGVDFVLVNRSGFIAGAVEDVDTGEPLPNARVEASSPAGTRSVAFSDSTGAFRIVDLVPTETYRVVAIKSGYFANEVIGIAPGDSTVVLRLLRRYGFVEGSVEDLTTGAPLADVPILATPNGLRGISYLGRTDANGAFLLRLVPDNYTVQPFRTHARSEPTFVQLDVAEVDTVEDVRFKLEQQQVQAISVQRADLSQKPSISNQEMHCYVASARDVNNRPVNIGTPLWSLDVSAEAATIDSSGCVVFNPNYFGDLTITARDPVSGVEGSLTVQVFVPIDSTTERLLFDDRGLRLRVPRGAVRTRKNLFVSKVPVAPAKRGRAEFFITDSSFVLKPAGLVFNKQPVLILDPPPNTEGQRILVGKWDDRRSEWLPLAATPGADGGFEAAILETGEYVAMADAKPLAVENLTLLPNPFSPDLEINGQKGLRIEFDLSSSAAPNPLLTLRIFNLEGNLVRLLHDQTPFNRGHAVVYWDGRTDHGAVARNGRYLVHLRVEDPKGSKELMKSVVLIK